MRVTIASMLFLAGLSQFAQADDILAAGLLYGGPDQAAAACAFYNAGTTAVTVKKSKIVDQTGAKPSQNNSCNDDPPLAAGRGCTITAQIGTGSGYSCRAVVSPNKKNARGVLTIFNGSTDPLVSMELR
ncbi:MAG TPA: hypothetical protein VGA77_05690 [Propylenella sp.]